MLLLLLPFALSLSDVDKVADVMEDIAETVSWIHPLCTAPSVAALLCCDCADAHPSLSLLSWRSLFSQIQMADEVNEQMAQPIGPQMDEDELNKELEEMESELMDSQLLAAPTVPSTIKSQSKQRGQGGTLRACPAAATRPPFTTDALRFLCYCGVPLSALSPHLHRHRPSSRRGGCQLLFLLRCAPEASRHVGRRRRCILRCRVFFRRGYQWRC